MIIKLTELREESGGCPTSYSAKTADGDYLYFRYRHGYMRIDFNDSIIAETNITFGSADGICSFNDFKNLARKNGFYIDDNNVTYSSYIDDIEETLRNIKWRI